jgi:uncharacterized phage-associated protein
MQYSAKAVANYFLELAEAEGKTLSPMKVQKLVYFAQGWCLAITGRSLIDEQVEAWSYGPVIPSLYHAFKRYGYGAITEPAERIWVDDDDWLNFHRTTPTLPDEESDPDVEFVKQLLKKVWDVYGKYSAIQLSNLTHEEGSPWYQLNREYDRQIPKGTDIPRKMMRDFFRKQAAAK